MIATYHDQSLGDILIAEGLITPAALSRILGERENATEPLGDLLVRLGVLSPKDRARCVGHQVGVPFFDLSQRSLDTEVVNLITHNMAARLLAIPVERSATGLSIAMANPMDIAALDELRAHTGLEIDPVIAPEEDIRDRIHALFGTYDDLGELVDEAAGASEKLDKSERGDPADEDDNPLTVSFSELKELSVRSPVIRLVNSIFSRAISRRASDIHINPEKGRVRVRFRVDGMLQEVITMPKNVQSPFLSRLKIMAGMDIAERRAPQDGRISLLLPQGEYDFRVSSYPSLYGENIVVRILDKKAARVELDKTGMQTGILARLQELIHRPHGMILVCGPTGSGKTTSLYACLNALNSADRNIMTIEDPVEYQLPGIVQGNVNPKAGVTFASGLRTLVRQDPDVILVGEIRDAETARIAIEAALTGHLVLSTIHANDAAGAITRLIDMGVEPFLVASALVATLAQRLVRMVCPRCAVSYRPETALLRFLGCETAGTDPGLQFRKGNGCDSCNRTGYKGRTGIHELMEVTGDVQRLILAHASSQEIQKIAMQDRPTLRDDAILKLLQGQTTPEEVARVTIA